MKTYRIGLTRTYLIEVEAENEERAKRLSEFFFGDISDESTPKDRDEYHFSFSEMEMVENEAIFVEEINE